ncbi:MAG TPA: hypothetical protein VHW65_09375 [Gemmatimonadales bacterium]|jgi:hypothetical protein|nr:hypothetical protein [Gemmatimonadales bacterium]
MATGRLIIAGTGLAALWQGAGTLDPVDLRSLADTAPGDARFIAITVGALVSGACLLPVGRSWQRYIAAVPLLAGLLPIVVHLPAGALFLGAAIGAVPSSVTLLSRRAGARRAELVPSTATGVVPADVGLLAAIVVATLVLPWTVTAAALLVATWWLPGRSRPVGYPALILPAVATALVLAWVWLGVTLSAEPWAVLHRFAADAPLSPSGAELVALITLGWGIALAAPWPLDRWASSPVCLPAIAVVLHAATGGNVADGTAHWLPLVTPLLVVAALGGLVRGRWSGAVAAIVLLAASRTGALALGCAVLAGSWPLLGALAGRFGRRVAIHTVDRLVAAAAGGLLAITVAVVLHDQVFLGVVLAFGAALAAGRFTGRVARI